MRSPRVAQKAPRFSYSSWSGSDKPRTSTSLLQTMASIGEAGTEGSDIWKDCFHQTEASLTTQQGGESERRLMLFFGLDLKWLAELNQLINHFYHSFRFLDIPDADDALAINLKGIFNQLNGIGLNRSPDIEQIDNIRSLVASGD